MKNYIFALALVLSVGAHAFEVSGNHFEGKFKIDSMTVGENEVTVNASPTIYTKSIHSKFRYLERP